MCIVYQNGKSLFKIRNSNKAKLNNNNPYFKILEIFNRNTSISN